MTEGFIWRELSFSSTTACCVGQLDCVAIRPTKALAGTTCPHQPQLGLPSTLCPLMQKLHWRLGLGINSVIAVWAQGRISDITKLLFPPPRLTSDLTCHLSFARVCPKQLTHWLPGCTQALALEVPPASPVWPVKPAGSCGWHAEAESSPSGFFHIPCIKSNLCTSGSWAIQLELGKV